MAEATKIEWADSTLNPWVGCTKIAPACDFCYAESWAKRSGMVEWGNAPRRRTSVQLWKQPLKWQDQAAAFFAEHGRRRRVFCASLADVFDNQVPPEWRADLWQLILQTPDLDWLLLTKRPQNIEKMLPKLDFVWDQMKGHVWLGTTVEDQKHADENIPHLLQHDSAVRFISAEPLLGPIDLDAMPFPDGDTRHKWSALTGQALMHATGVGGHPDFTVRIEKPLRRKLDWVITGGESGPQARPSNPQWFRDLQGQCNRSGVPYLFKQWGEWASVSEVAGEGRHFSFDDGRTVRRVGKKNAGRLLDGVEHNGFPEPRAA